MCIYNLILTYKIGLMYFYLLGFYLYVFKENFYLNRLVCLVMCMCVSEKVR